MASTIQNWLSLSYQYLQKQGKEEDAWLSLQVLLGFHLEKSRVELLTHPEHIIPDDVIPTIDAAVQQLASGVPLPYLLGFWDFFGLPFKVTPDTLIPRPETELLVENCLEWLKNHPQIQKPLLLDIGTGTGCIPVSISVNMPELLSVATDRSSDAINVARKNAASHNVGNRIDFVVNHLCTAIEGSFHVVTANLPYIPTKMVEKLAVSKYEPQIALDGGEQGTELMDELLALLPQYLLRPGLIVLEHQDDQLVHMSEIAARAFPSGKITNIKDYSGKDRILRIELL